MMPEDGGALFVLTGCREEDAGGTELPLREESAVGRVALVLREAGGRARFS